MERQRKDGQEVATVTTGAPRRHDSRPYWKEVTTGVPIMVFPKRRNAEATAGVCLEVAREVATEGVCFAMEEKLESKSMEAQPPKGLDKKTDEVTDVNQVIPLNTVYERAGVPPPVPLNDISSSHHRMPLEDESADPLIGDKVAGYIVEDSIAAGGMGIVYRARQPEIGRCVAIKVLRPEVALSAEQSSRFFREAQALSVIRHKGVTDIIQWGCLSDKRQYMVMEYLEGDNLEDIMGRDGPKPAHYVIWILKEVLAALSAAHRAGVVHRDLKPSNIFIAKQSDGSLCVKLLDFGLARQQPVNALAAGADTGADNKPEKASMVAGTPEYIAPEQARGLAATPRTDIYSLGIVAFEMLAGRLPFPAQSTVEMMQMHAYSEVPDIRDYAENIPNTLAELLAAMVKKKPEERPRSTDEVQQRLARIEQQLKDEKTVATQLPPALMGLDGQLSSKKKTFLQEWLGPSPLLKVLPIVLVPTLIGLVLWIILAPVPSLPPQEVPSPPPVPTEPPVVVQPVDTRGEEMTPPVREDVPPSMHVVQTVPAEKGRRPPSTSKTKVIRPPNKLPPDAQPRPPPALNVSLMPTNCDVDLDTWKNSVTDKIATYNQRLRVPFGDNPTVWKTIQDERAKHRENLKNSNNAADCLKISEDLDQWLRGYARKLSGGS